MREPTWNNDESYQVWLFENWFATKDLGPLEDVRAYVSAHALQNCCDVPVESIAETAKATVLMYLDVPEEAAEVFDFYRN